MKRVPMITGVLAGLAGFLTVRSANMSNQAIYNSNQAVLHQALASDHWAEYQSDSVKRHIDENSILVGVSNPKSEQLISKQVTELRDRQSNAKQQAQNEEALRVQELQNGQKKLAIKDFLDYAGVAAQLGIALSSVAALTKKKPAFHAGLFAGAVAILVTGYALVEPYVAHLLGH